ncbi:hypothetical protein [Nocardioides rubriscoriae]|uniref:hypothetical protein n=1 Tax=Nocardioides rubriscoriae TaxID=642762 RepID=UPI0011E03682|nr:hypothetical protein [Nocardioides rubriscoriae]
MRLPVLALVAALALGATACSNEEPAPYDDGRQGVPLAGLGPEIEDAGVEVLAAATPDAATTDDVVPALADAQVDSPTTDVREDVLAFDPAATAGLLGIVTDAPGSTVVLVFATPDNAAVFAADDPTVFGDPDVESERAAFLAGNLVGYAADDSGRPVRLRRALNALGGSAS